ncbi:MAG: hypothetical protein Q8P70_00280 [bacterium]|nr:hypothetical protein [bacterium]
MKEYSKDETWKIYKTLPQELQEAMFSEETADHIFKACERSDVNEVSKVAYYTGLVLLGLVLPADFQSVLQKEIGLPKKNAQDVAQEIQRFVFFPVRRYIQELHGEVAQEKPGRQITPASPGGAEKTAPANASPAQSPYHVQEKVKQEPIVEEEVKEQPPKEPKSEDPYHEPLE